MMRQWLRAYSVEAVHEKVHTVEDMRRFLQREGKNVATRIIHVMGHGQDDPGAGSATFSLTFEDLHLVDQVEVFRGLEGKIIIFSCCEVGADQKAMKKVKEASGAAGVIGYRVAVHDWYTNLAEVMLYDRLINSSCSPQSAVRLVNGALKALGTQVHDRIVRKPVLVCY
jgi:hypothetical protein